MHDLTGAMARTPIPAQLRIVGWPDPIIDRLGFPPHHPYSELIWLPATGPAATLAWRRLGQLLDQNPDGFDLDVAQFAQDLGLGVGSGNHSIISRTLRRLAAFELAIFLDDQTCAVRRRIPPAPARQLRRLSPQLLRIHTALLASHDDERLGRERADSTSLPRGA